MLMNSLSVHVTNLEKYLPGYKDRALSWFKIYFRNSIDGDSKFKCFFDDELIERLSEIDRYRYLSLIAMEAQLGRPVPLDAKRLAAMGWNIKKHPISLTLNMLQGLVEVCTEEINLSGKVCTVDKEKEEDKDKEEETRSGSDLVTIIQSQWNAFATDNNLPAARTLNAKRHSSIKARLTEPDFNLTDVLREIRQSDFLLGKTKDWRVDFDFVFCSPNNYVKILEGKYRNGNSWPAVRPKVDHTKTIAMTSCRYCNARVPVNEIDAHWDGCEEFQKLPKRDMSAIFRGKEGNRGGEPRAIGGSNVETLEQKPVLDSDADYSDTEESW